MNTAFSDLGIPDSICSRLSDCGIAQPTAVQKAVFPILLQGKQLIFRSGTGTGKTLAYALPLLSGIRQDLPKVQILIAAPTYELASQIRTEIRRISGIPAALCIGNTSIARQIEALKTKPLIVIGSAARIIELINLKKIRTDSLQALVLDEADRLLTRELKDSTEGLIRLMPPHFRLIACSATVKEKHQEMLAHMLPEGHGQIQTLFMPAEDILKNSISHFAIYSEHRDKMDTLRKTLVAAAPAKAIVFTARTADAVKTASYLQSRGENCASLYAKSDKVQRKQAIDRFRSGKCRILVTSDLSARGLDINGITHIIQLDMPADDEAFIHRAGRTARAGAKGINIVIGSAYEMNRLALLEKKLGITVYPKIVYKGKLTAPDADTPHIRDI